MEKKYLSIPFDAAEAGKLRIGDYVCLTGTIYSARDAAHQRMQEALDRGEELPFPVKGSVIYYMGPTPARPGRPIGSAGPTTASRMDKYTPRLLDLGMAAMVGKGRRSPAVLEATMPSTLPPWAAPGQCCPTPSARRKSSPIPIWGRRPSIGWRWWISPSS